MEEYDIIIIGAGWYGCHIALKLQNKYKILILEKESEIFKKSSYYNQNRVHEGYHYARDFNTRNLCQKYYNRFISEYSECIKDVEKNYYCISKDSLICGRTYLSIFRHEDFNFTIDKNNNMFTHIYGNPLQVDEKMIISELSKEFFKRELNNVNINCNTEVKSIIEFNKFIMVNNNFKCKLLLDCTFGQIGFDKREYIYELTLSLIYKKQREFGGLTIVDGNFCSIYPHDNDNNYTLTDVEHTPIIKSNNFNSIKDYQPTDEEIESKRVKMEEKIKLYFPSFDKYFTYKSYFLSFKTKMVSGSDTRDISIFQNNNIISVNCGKIYGIFEWEEYVNNFLLTNNI